MRRPLVELRRSLSKRKISRRSKKPRAGHTVAPTAAGIITGCAGMATAGVLAVDPASAINMRPPKPLAASFGLGHIGTASTDLLVIFVGDAPSAMVVQRNEPAQALRPNC
jgi:hypothetical protein